MALNNLGLGVVFTASDLASNVIRRVSSNFLGLDQTVSSVSSRMAKRLGTTTEVMTTSLKTLAAGVAIAAVGFAGLGTSFKLAGAAGEFEQGIAAVGAVTKATRLELQLLEKAAIDAGVATQFSPVQAVEGLRSLATAGQTVEQATRTLIPVLDLAAGSLGDLGVAGAAEAVVGTLNAYSLSADRAAGVTDRLLRITQLTNFQTRDFGAGLAKAAASGAIFNQELNDVLISLGLLRNRNIDASSSATALREATARLGSQAAAQNAITSQGVDVFDKQTGEMRSLLDVMTEFAVATANLTDKEKGRLVQTAFGRRGLLAFSAVQSATFTTIRDGTQVVLEGAEAIAALRREMSSAEGTARAFRDALLDTFEGQKTLLAGTLDTIAIAIGKPFAKVLAPVVEGVVGTLNTLLQIFLEIPDPIKRFFAGFFTLGSVAAIVVGIGLAIKGLIGILGGLAAVGGPLFAGLLLGLASLAAQAFVLKRAWETNFGGIRDLLLPIFEQISLGARGLFELFSSGEISGALAEELLKAENTGLLRFIEVLSESVEVARAIFSGLADGVGEAFSDMSEIVKPFFSELGSAFGEIFSLLRAFPALAEALGLEDPGQGALKTIAGLTKAFVKFTAAVLTPFVRFFVNVARLITGVVRGVVAVVDFIGSAFDRNVRVAKAGFDALTSFGLAINDVIRSAWLATGRFIVRMINRVISAATSAAVSLSFLADPTGNLGRVIAARGASLQIPGGGEGAPGTTGAPGAAGLPGAASSPLPSAATPAGISRGLSPSDLALLVQELGRQRAAERDRPVVVQGEVVLDGETVGTMRAQEESERASRRGAFSPAIGGG